MSDIGKRIKHLVYVGDFSFDEKQAIAQGVNQMLSNMLNGVELEDGFLQFREELDDWEDVDVTIEIINKIIAAIIKNKPDLLAEVLLKQWDFLVKNMLNSGKFGDYINDHWCNNCTERIPDEPRETTEEG